jgi:flagellar biosynthetic protein FliR
MDLFTFDPQEFLSFLLTLFRISLILFLMPFFGGRVLPTPVKAALCLVLTLGVWPTLSYSGTLFPGNTVSIVLMLVGELFTGLVLALMVQVIFSAVQTGGNIVGFQMGFAMINVADPLTGGNETIAAHLLYMISILTFLTLNGHLYLLQALADSFKILPPGGLYVTAELTDRVLEYSSQIFVLAVKIAAPVMVSIFIVDLSLALIGRAAPQMHVLVFGFPIKITVGFIFMGMLFTILARFILGFIEDMGPLFRELLHMGAPGG